VNFRFKIGGNIMKTDKTTNAKNAILLYIINPLVDIVVAQKMKNIKKYFFDVFFHGRGFLLQ
jgi:hypothetical protein